jgi:hypothetical protein
LKRRKMHTTFLWENVKEERRFEELDLHERLISKRILKK